MTYTTKTVVINLLIIIIVGLLSVGGGVAFVYFEKEVHEKEWETQKQSTVNCTAEFLDSFPYRDPEGKALQIFQKCIAHLVPKTHWEIVGASIFSFASITTIGYGSFLVTTHAGRIFYMIYCLISMPFGLLLMGNLGLFVQDGVSKLRDKMLACFQARKKQMKKVCPEDGLVIDQPTKDEDVDDDEEEFEISTLVFLVLFVLYVACGVAAMMIASHMHVVDSVYKNFQAFTAIDLSEVISTKLLYFPIGITYVIGGLALCSLAVDILSRRLKELHSVGKKLEHSGRQKVWFNGKRISVNELVRAAGTNWGVEKEKIRNTDLDKLIIYVIAVKEGTAVKKEVIPAPEPKQEADQPRKESSSSESEDEPPQQRWGYFFKGEQKNVKEPLPKLKDCGKKKIWFGRTRITLDKLVEGVGKEFGLDEDTIKNINLEKILKQTIIENRGGTTNQGLRKMTRAIQDQLDPGTEELPRPELQPVEPVQPDVKQERKSKETGKSASSKLQNFINSLRANQQSDSGQDLQLIEEHEAIANHDNSDFPEEQTTNLKLRRITKLFGMMGKSKPDGFERQNTSNEFQPELQRRKRGTDSIPSPNLVQPNLAAQPLEHPPEIVQRRKDYRFKPSTVDNPERSHSSASDLTFQILDGQQQQIEHSPETVQPQKDYGYKYSTVGNPRRSRLSSASDITFQTLDGEPLQHQVKFDPLQSQLRKQRRELKRKNIQTMTNCGQAKVWFGPAKLTVQELISAVGEELGVDKVKIDNTDIDQIVKQKIIAQLGNAKDLKQ